MKSRSIVAGAAVVLGAAGAFVSAVRLLAQPEGPPLPFQPFTISGLQASPSAPFIVQGDPIGKNAVWQRLVGPVLSSVFAVIPPAAAGSSFNGAGCQADYSQDQIVAQGGTIELEVIGFRCTADPDPVFLKAGVYNIKGGTGQFSDINGGTGSISFNHRSDGSVLLAASGAHLVGSGGGFGK